MNVLVIEDDKIWLRTIEKILSQHMLRSVDNLSAAIETLNNSSIDFVILDLNLSKYNFCEGLELLPLINERKIGCLILTGTDCEKDIKKIRRKYPFEILLKKNYKNPDSLSKDLSIAISNYSSPLLNEILYRNILERGFSTVVSNLRKEMVEKLKNNKNLSLRRKIKMTGISQKSFYE